MEDGTKDSDIPRFLKKIMKKNDIFSWRMERRSVKTVLSKKNSIETLLVDEAFHLDSKLCVVFYFSQENLLKVTQSNRGSINFKFR
jgi:hypothetical protein